LRAIPWALLILFMAKVGTYENARQLTPYYAFFFPALLVNAGHAHLVRKRWWQWLGILLMTFTALLLVISRNRPLFPAQTILTRLHAKFPQSKFIARAELSFDVRSSVVEQQNYFAKHLPPDEHVVGFASTLGSSEPGLWFPLGQRRVEWVLPGDTSEQLLARHINYVVVEYNALNFENENIQQWMEKYHGELAGQLNFLLRPGEPQFSIYLVHLRPPQM
jgi:energy-coupling factor transporter transmembrane protein EcfT